MGEKTKEERKDTRGTIRVREIILAPQIEMVNWRSSYGNFLVMTWQL
jgi:hypothetical protein